jgi:Protein of unknown function (DUF4238)
LADHKNQHFVPKCALKPFSLNGEGHAINLFNITNSRAVMNASVKRQCSRDYFYGKGDLSAEKQLSNLEGEYARVVKVLIENESLSDEDKSWLHLFMFVQMRRTERAVEETRSFHNSIIDEAFKDNPQQKPPPITDIEAVALSMSSGLKSSQESYDLKLIVLRNRTKIDFVISDNPSVLTNKYHFKKLNKADFGVASSGTLISMPLSPRFYAMIYDKGVYSIPNASGTPLVDIRRVDDVAALNELQFISADKNIYFSDWADRDRLPDEVANVATLRSHTKNHIQTLVRDMTNSAEQVYRSGTRDEEAASNELLITMSNRYPRPSAFPSVIKFRGKPKTFSDGSAAGVVRRPDWLNS